MKKYLFVILVILISNLSIAQHYENQINFKKGAVVRTPRFRTDNNNVLQESSLPQSANNEIELKCSALMNVKADSYLAIFNLTQVATTAKEADDLINKRIQVFFDNLKTLGLSSSDFYVDMVYLIPVFEFEVSKKFFSKTYNEVPKGFEMQKNVHIKFKGSNIIDKIVTTASLSEIYDLVTVEYFVNNPSVIYDTLRAATHRYLKANAARLKSSGINLAEHFSSLQEETDVVYPESRYSDYEAFVSQSLEAARNAAVTNVRKPKTVAYNKLPYNEFDIVINSEFTEPVVQYTYDLSLKYILPDKQGNKNKYFIIDSNGNLKEVLIK